MDFGMMSTILAYWVIFVRLGIWWLIPLGVVASAIGVAAGEAFWEEKKLPKNAIDAIRVTRLTAAIGLGLVFAGAASEHPFDTGVYLFAAIVAGVMSLFFWKDYQEKLKQYRDD